MNELTKAASFFFEDIHSIRIIEQENSRWFVAADICDVLDIKKSGRTFKDFPENEKGWYNISSTLSDGYIISGTSKRTRARKTQKMLIVNEAGLYRLVFKSRKPEAKRFQTWVFEEVLPSIRKYGFYNASRPKIWPDDDKRLTWGGWINKNAAKHKKQRPDDDFDGFLKTLPI